MCRVCSLALVAIAIVLSVAPASGSAAVPGPNGRVAFNSGSFVGFVEADGSGEQRVVAFAAHPSWFPDGQRLAFETAATSSGDVFTSDLRGRDVRPVAASPAVELDPAVSPDGRLVAYSSNEGVGGAAIWIAGVDGESPRRLTEGVDIDKNPAWSPDGRLIAFTTLSGMGAGREGANGSSVFTVDVATGALSLVATNGTVPGSGSINSESRVSFAPDGRRLALAAYGSGGDSSSQVVAVNLDGSGALRLTDIPQGAGDPSWSPDGQRVAYYANGAIETVRADGTDVRRLVAGNGSPDWGPPGPPLPPGGPCSVERLGTAGSDTLEGTDAADDDLSGLGGSDVLRGLAGDDCLRGGSGNDTLFGGAGEDRLLGQAGKDQLSGGDGDDRLAGGAGIDDLEGGDDRDQLSGGGGKDALKGGAGNDSLIGGGGVNTYAAGAGIDRVSARNGEAEVVNCGPGRDRARTDPSDVRISCERQLGRGR